MSSNAYQELTVIAWLWARTVKCPNPACGVDAPLIKSPALSTRRNPSYLSFNTETGSFDVRAKKDEDFSEGTVSRRGATCIKCRTPISLDSLRKAGRNDELGEKLLAIVAEGDRQRVFIGGMDLEKTGTGDTQPEWQPDAELPHNPFAVRPPLYGLDKIDDLFTPRQLLLLDTLCGLTRTVSEKVEFDGKKNGVEHDEASEYSLAIRTYLAFLVDQIVNHHSSICGWNSANAQMRNVFARQAIPMTWDYAEANPFSDSSGSFNNLHERQVKAFSTVAGELVGQASQSDARVAFEEFSDVVVSTDPPYYNNIDYADLSDFFYVWLRRCLKDIYPDILSTLAAPKTAEIVASPFRHDNDKDLAKAYFENGLAKTFEAMHSKLNSDAPLTVFYAFKQSEVGEESSDRSAAETAHSSTGWETMLSGLIAKGLMITATWPMRTEKKGRSMGIGMNALASSVILCCRRRPIHAAMVTRNDFVNLLRQELPKAINYLQAGNVAPVDLTQASIGPGMAVFSRYSKVVNADGASMPVREALQLINQVLDESLVEQESDFDSETRFALRWFEQYGLREGPFGDAETLAKAMAVAVNSIVESGIAKSGASKVRLLKRDELHESWDPQADDRTNIWEATQYLVKALESGGESEAAGLLGKLGSAASETARELAYRLYQTCERAGDAKGAGAYNSLVVSWPVLLRLSQEAEQLTDQNELNI